MASSISLESPFLALWLTTSILIAALWQLHVAEGALQVGFYDSACSSAESVVKSAVRTAFDADRSIAASLVRLHFHDCFVEGCDASILLTGAGTEQTAPPNLSVRGYAVISDAKAQVEAVCPGVVSCADITALAARDSVEILGGAPYSAETGRFDGTAPGATVILPGPNMTVSEATPFFTNLGLTQEEMVTLIGAHTVGVAQCQFFVDRLYNFKGTSLPDPSLDTSFLASLQSLCPNVANDVTNVALDDTSGTFDTNYFKSGQRARGVLRIDQEIADDASTSGRVNALANSPAVFGSDFGAAMVAMGRIGVLTSGNVRTVCEMA